MKQFILKIKKLLIEPNKIKNIAFNGWVRGHRDYNERLITEFMLDTLFGKNNKLYPWPKIIY